MNKQKSKPFSLARIAFYVLSLIMFAIALRHFGQPEVMVKLLNEMNPAWLMLAVGAQLMTYVLNASILMTLLHQEQRSAHFFDFLKLSVVILFVNQALPSGGISGNGYLFGQLLRRKIAARSAFATLVLESICYYIAFLMLLAIFFIWYSGQVEVPAPAIRYTVLAGFIFFILLGFLLVLVSDKHTVAWLLNKLSRFQRIRRYIVSRGLLSLQEGQGSGWKWLFKDKRAIIAAVILQLAILFCDLLTVLAIMRGFHCNLTVGLIMLGLLLTLVIGSLPVSPGALIAYESAMTYFYTLLGLPLHTALTVTLLFRLFSFWLPIPLGLVFYRNLKQ
jgi:uncharacterized protein (TIRG00374 family)